MPSPIQHPVLGMIVPDQWNDDLLTLREFPHMRPFWSPDGQRADASLTSQQRAWIDAWRDHTANLAQICRDGNVHTALQSRGIYEVSIDVPEEDDGGPAASQVAAYQYVNENEEGVCQNAADALLRYYRAAREEMPDWFEDEEYPDDPTVEQLAEFVGFDGFCIARCASGGMSPLRLSWDPDWDPEHGLLMVVFQDQVLAIGSDDVDDFLQDPEAAEEFEYCMWKASRMTEAERSMRQQFIDGFEPLDEED